MCIRDRDDGYNIIEKQVKLSFSVMNTELVGGVLAKDTDNGGVKEDDLRRAFELSLGYTRNTMAVNRGMQSREAERTPKSRPSSDRRLQPACVKSESLVIAGQHTAVNTLSLIHI